MRYRPRRVYEGPAVVVRCALPGQDLTAPRDFGWSRWVNGPITVVELVSEHLDVLRPPMVAELGVRLRDELRRVDRP